MLVALILAFNPDFRFLTLLTSYLRCLSETRRLMCVILSETEDVRPIFNIIMMNSFGASLILVSFYQADHLFVSIHLLNPRLPIVNLSMDLYVTLSLLYCSAHYYCEFQFKSEITDAFAMSNSSISKPNDAHQFLIHQPEFAPLYVTLLLSIAV